MTMNTTISKYDDIISFDLLMEEIEALKDERDIELDQDDKDDAVEELNELVAFAKELEDVGNAIDCTFINIEHFKEYLKEQFEDSSGYDSDIPELQYIDWDRVARDYQTNYSMVEFGDRTFLYMA